MRKPLSYYLVAFFILCGFILSVVSYFELCSVECKAGHNWRLFGLPLGPIGIIAFGGLLLAHLFSWRNLVEWGLMAALGMEIMFIWVQKYKIGHWCPVCLGIAASVVLALLVYQIYQGDSMRSFKNAFGSALALALGFGVAFFGLAPYNKLHAAEQSIKEKIAFGNHSSPIKMFLFTDWQCPACRQIEPKLKLLMNNITKNATLTFVDMPVHPETLNFSPYNLSFMINNKAKYIELRDDLTALSMETKEPTDKQIQGIAKKNGVIFTELNYADVAVGLKYWKELAQQFEIDGTPILVIVNPKAKKGKKLAGVEEINQENILRAIESLK